MVHIVAVAAFGRELPDVRFLLVFAGLAVLFLLFNRNGGLSSRSGRAGSFDEGMEYQCKRCGRQFHPQTSTQHSDGRVERVYNDRCPNCGWDLDWGKPDAFGNPGH